MIKIDSFFQWIESYQSSLYSGEEPQPCLLFKVASAVADVSCESLKDFSLGLPILWNGAKSISLIKMEAGLLLLMNGFCNLVMFVGKCLYQSTEKQTWASDLDCYEKIIHDGVIFNIDSELTKYIGTNSIVTLTIVSALLSAELFIRGIVHLSAFFLNKIVDCELLKNDCDGKAGLMLLEESLRTVSRLAVAWIMLCVKIVGWILSGLLTGSPHHLLAL